MKDAMLKTLLGSMINPGLVDNIKNGIMEFANKKQTEHNSHLVLVAQKVEGQEDICISVYSKADPAKTELVETIYLSQLTVDHIKQLLS